MMFILLEDMKTKATRFTIFFAVSMLYPQVAMHRHHPGASPPLVAMGKRMFITAKSYLMHCIKHCIKYLMYCINSISWPLERSLWSQGTSHFELCDSEICLNHTNCSFYNTHILTGTTDCLKYISMPSWWFKYFSMVLILITTRIIAENSIDVIQSFAISLNQSAGTRPHSLIRQSKSFIVN
mgnify:CR=1 FL=1